LSPPDQLDSVGAMPALEWRVMIGLDWSLKGDRLQVFVVDLLQQPLGFRLGDVAKGFCAGVYRERWMGVGELENGRGDLI
jgi:hypothetical protein